MRRLGLGIAWIGVAIAAAAPAQQAQTSVQQDFDAATALYVKGDFPAALAAWDALAKRVTESRRTQAIIQVRRGDLLLVMKRFDEAAESLREGLSGLPTNDASLTEDRYEALINLGAISQAQLDYASAADFYAQAEPLGGDTNDKLRALIRLIHTATYVDPDAAEAADARALSLLSHMEVTKGVQAEFARARGQLLLNRGDFKGAKAAFMQAVRLLGGLTQVTGLDDVQARSDVAISAMLLGDTSTAREYMAMSGAGRLNSGSFDPAVVMTAPDCGGDADLKPDDMAIVEFSIDTDGSVIGATPVYAAGGGKVAIEFARAASRWSWTPEQAKQLPTFFRFFARVEMRCSTTFERPSIGDAIDGAVEAWLLKQGVTVPDRGAIPDARALPAQRAAFEAAKKHDPDSLETLMTAYVLLENLVMPRDSRGAVAETALGIAEKRQAPPLVQLRFDLARRDSQSIEMGYGAGRAKLLSAMLGERAYSAPEAQAALRIMLADLKRNDDAGLLLQEVAGISGLAPNDPLRIAALVRLASFDQQRGDNASARDAFAKTGLSADQCALIDAPPRLSHVGGTFPMEAQQWGFEGWTQTQFDIDADGKVVNERAIISYPPFVFTKAGTDTIAGARYSKTYRPNGGLGCGGTTERVRFIMPH